jgi:hypothetical protein
LRRSRGNTKVRNARVQIEQLVLVGGQTEEIGFLLGPLDRRAERLTPDTIVAERRFRFVEIGFLANRIPAGIFVEIDGARLLQGDPQRLNGALMALLGGANVVVIGNVERSIHLAKTRRIPVGQFERRQAFLDGGLLHLQTMLIRSGQETNVVAVEPLEAGNRVGRHDRIGMTDMRHAIGIEDRRCQKIRRSGCIGCRCHG